MDYKTYWNKGKKAICNKKLIPFAIIVGATLIADQADRYHRRNYPELQKTYNKVVPISDLNNDSIPELQIYYNNNRSIDTLISNIEGNSIQYHK